jgi:hypothetical protein
MIPKTAELVKSIMAGKEFGTSGIGDLFFVPRTAGGIGLSVASGSAEYGAKAAAQQGNKPVAEQLGRQYRLFDALNQLLSRFH